MRKSIIYVFIVLSAVWMSAKEPADYVNPFIGASNDVDASGTYHGLGKTFPGAVTPFGMTQLSPQTIHGGDNGSGYSYEHRTIEGFSMTQMSGVGWFGDLGNFTVMPTTDKLVTFAGKEGTPTEAAGWRSAYDKESEVARANYYGVRLTDYDIKMETTASPHGGIFRMSFPRHDSSRILIDLAHRVGGTAEEEYLKVVDDHTVEGWMRCTPECGGWGNGDGNALYTVYFHAEFSKPLKEYGFWSVAMPEGRRRKIEDVQSEEYQKMVAEADILRGISELQGKHIGFFVEFPTAADERVELKSAISFVDLEGARKNFASELCGKTFDDIEREGRESWNRELGRVNIKGGTEDERTVFYTALYHTMIDPRLYADVDGRYVGGDHKVHEGDGKFTKRTVFSGWDVFRSQFPMLTIVRPEIVGDMLGSLVSMAEQSGREYYERWEFLNAYSGCMLGNPAISVLADAYAKGIYKEDIERAYLYAKNSSARFGNDERGFTPGGTGLSHTLEYAYTDWCIAEMARLLGKEDDEKAFLAKSEAWKVMYDPEKGWFRPKNEDGSWIEWPERGRLEEWYGAMESNALQQGWFVPHDVAGMARTMGGREAVVKDLQWMFENTPKEMYWNDYYNHANEPVHFVPYLFNQLDSPWLTQYWTRFICANAYGNKVEGLCGNEDVGQMSAWYVLSSMGIHQACPGDTRFEITSPLFDEVTLAESGFTVCAHGQSPENVYIQKIELDGMPYNKTWIDYSDIAAGKRLDIYLGPSPRKENWEKRM